MRESAKVVSRSNYGSVARGAPLWMAAVTALASSSLFDPQRAAACGGPACQEFLPRVEGLRTVAELPVNGWVYWRPSAPGGPVPDPITVTITDTRTGELVAFDVELDRVPNLYALKPSTPLVEGVTYEVVDSRSTCGSSYARLFIATPASIVTAESGGSLGIVGEGAYEFRQALAGTSPAAGGQCTTPAEGFYADVQVTLAPELEPWRDSLIVDWQVDGASSVGSSVDGLYPLPRPGASLAGPDRIRLGIACAAKTEIDGTVYPLYDRGFAPGEHRVEAFARIAGASTPVPVGSITVTLACPLASDAGVTAPDAGGIVAGATPTSDGGCACAAGGVGASRRSRSSSLACAALFIALVAAARRMRQRAR